MLSGGQRKLLELARILMADPETILLDEPAAGVNPTLLELIIDRVLELNAQGKSILLIEHNMDMVARLCCARRRHGRRPLPDRRHAGRYRQRPGRRRRLSRRGGLMAADAPVVLSTAALVAGYERDLPIVRGVDFAVRAGELVVVLGPNGAGKSTFVKAIAGLVPIHSGTAALGDVDITAVPAHEKIRHGLAFVPQTENIFATLSIHDNLLLAADILPKEKRGQRIAALYAMFPDLAERPSRRAGALSGGQRQMLAVARALIVEPSVLILDEPSAGLSPKIVAEVFARLKEINARRRHHRAGRAEREGGARHRRPRRHPGRGPRRA